jgi:excisionase family DNA binding protein
MRQQRSTTDDLSAEPPRFYSVAEVAEITGLSDMTIYRSIADGELPAVRIRRRVLVPAKALDVMADAAMSGVPTDGSDRTPGGLA